MSEQYTEEEQAVIDSILGKDTPKQDVSWNISRNKDSFCV